MIDTALAALLELLAVPGVGLTALFVASLLAATLLPLGSEPVLAAVLLNEPGLLWPALGVATLGNTLGGAIGYGMGYGAREAFTKERASRWFGWLQRFGARTMLLAWVPLIGDPICVLGGWLRLPFWPSVFYMALGKLLRYLVLAWPLAHWAGLPGQ